MFFAFYPSWKLLILQVERNARRVELEKGEQKVVYWFYLVGGGFKIINSVLTESHKS
jgi:hypothetical protein